MYSLNKIIKTISLIALTLGCFALSPTARAVDPPPDGGYPNQNTAEGEDALFSLTTGADNTAMGFDALDSNTTGSDNALASWTWRATGRLNTARYVSHGDVATKRHGPCCRGTGQNAIFSRAPNCTTRRAGPGLPQAASTPHAVSHTATLLQNGMVLVAGGFDSCQCFRERRTVRPGERDLDCHRQPQHRTRFSHGDVATKRHGPCCRGS